MIDDRERLRILEQIGILTSDIEHLERNARRLQEKAKNKRENREYFKQRLNEHA